MNFFAKEASPYQAAVLACSQATGLLLESDGHPVKSEIVRSHWSQGQLPHFSGITLGDGRLIVMSESSYMAEGRILCHVSPICESSISSFVQFSGEFIEITNTTPSLQLNESMCAIG